MPLAAILLLMAEMAESSSLSGSRRSCALVKPSALTNARLESVYCIRTPSFGFQFTGALRCACAAAAADMAVRTVRRVRVTKRRYDGRPDPCNTSGLETTAGLAETQSQSS